MRILAFGTYDARTHPRVGVLIEGLRDAGDEVVEVNLPLGIATADRVAMLQRPWRLPLLAFRLMRCWTGLAWRARRVRRSFRPEAVLVGYLGHFDVRLARRLFRRTTIVLDHLVSAEDTSLDRGEKARWKLGLLSRLDRAALEAADLIVVDTDENLALLPVDLAERGIVVPVGASEDWFRARPAEGRRVDGTMKAVFFGLFTPLQGATTLARALALLADEPRLTTTLIGSGQDHPEARRLVGANRHVVWRGWVPAEELPGVVGQADVCLGIFGEGPKALRVVPNKVYQGAAAGCAIVTADTRPQRAALGEAAIFVPPADPDALAAALRTLIDDPEALAGLRSAAAARATTTFTAAATVRDLRQRLGAL